MRPVLTAAEMREADRRTIEEIGLPGVVLMENAGAAVERAIGRRWPQAARVVVLCGKGNNGGDGFVVARRLGPGRARVLLLGTRGETKGDARTHLQALERSGGRVEEVADLASWRSHRAGVAAADLIVDALLGTGLHSEPSGLVAEVIADLLALRGGGGPPVAAVDVPSGLPSDAGAVPWAALEADLTVTFAASKYGHVLPPACDRMGALEVADIGIPHALLAQARLWLLDDADARAVYPQRPAEAHKGRFGHVLVVAGSAGKSGAAVLAGTGALFSGAGLVTVASPAPAQPLVAAARPELMTEPLPAEASGELQGPALERALSLAAGRDAVVLGPGLGTEAGTQAFVREFVARCPAPLVVDADGLNALAAAGGGPATLRRSAPTVLTPHPGEAARLLGTTTAAVAGARLEAARDLARHSGAVAVLKGHRTLVARPDGVTAVNATGNPGMASGGTGDVLAGMIGALLARSAEAWTAATAAVHLHGSAGDVAARRRGQEAMTAGDLLEGLPSVLRELEARHR